MFRQQLNTKPNIKLVLILVVPCIFILLVFYFMGFTGNTPKNTLTPENSIVNQEKEASKDQASTNVVSTKISSSKAFDIETGTIFDFSIKLLLVIAVIFVVYKILLYLRNRSSKNKNNPAAIKIIEAKNLAQNQSLYLIKIGNKALLIGGTATQLSMLTEITDEKTLNDLDPDLESKFSCDNPFSKQLQKFISINDPQSTVKMQSGLIVGKVKDSVEMLRELTNKIKNYAA